MIYTRTRALMLASLTSLALLAGCGGNESNNDKPAAPTEFIVTPGDGSVTVEWKTESGLTYWLFSAQGEGLTRANYRSGGTPRILVPVSSGYVQTNVTNGLPYSFFLNATRGTGPAGDETPTITVTPRLAGDNWAAPATILDGNAFNGVAYFNGRYVAVGDNGKVYLSTDRKKWAASSVAIPTTKALYGVAAATGIAFAVGAEGTILHSTDADTWTAAKSVPTTVAATTLRSVVAGSDGYIAVGDGGVVLRSTDGDTWVELAADKKPAGLTAKLRSAKYLNGTVMIVGDNGTVIHSATTTDLSAGLRAAVTTESLHEVTLGAGTFVAVGGNGVVIASRDGITWYKQSNIPSVASSTTFNAVGLGSRFLAVGENGLAIIGVVTDANAATDAMLSWVSPNPSGKEPHSPPAGNMTALQASSLGYLAITADGKSIAVF